ncbi:MAG: hypothetical protein ACLPID_19260 [Beijerinckiaceae bacterium]
MNVIDSNNLERDAQISLRNLRKLDCAGKAAQRPTFPHPALGEMHRSRTMQVHDVIGFHPSGTMLDFP